MRSQGSGTSRPVRSMVLSQTGERLDGEPVSISALYEVRRTSESFGPDTLAAHNPKVGDGRLFQAASTTCSGLSLKPPERLRSSQGSAGTTEGSCDRPAVHDRERKYRPAWTALVGQTVQNRCLILVHRPSPVEKQTLGRPSCPPQYRMSDTRSSGCSCACGLGLLIERKSIAIHTDYIGSTASKRTDQDPCV